MNLSEEAQTALDTIRDVVKNSDPFGNTPHQIGEGIQAHNAVLVIDEYQAEETRLRNHIKALISGIEGAKNVKGDADTMKLVNHQLDYSLETVCNTEGI